MSEELMPHLDDGEDEFSTDELSELSAEGAEESQPGAPEEAESEPESPRAEEIPPPEDAGEADLTILLAAGAEEVGADVPEEAPPEPEAEPQLEASPMEGAEEEPPAEEVPPMEAAGEAAETTLLEGADSEPDEEDMTPVLPAEEDAEPTILEPVDFESDETQIEAPALSAEGATGAESSAEPAAADDEMTEEEATVEERIVFEDEAAEETPEWQGTDEMPDWLEADDSTRQHERPEGTQPTPTSDIFATLADLPGLEAEPSTLIRGRAGKRARKGAKAAPGAGDDGGFRGRTVVLLVFASVLMCVVILGGLYALYLLTGSVPEQVARFVPPTLATSSERAASPTPSPTVTRTPAGEEEAEEEEEAPVGGVATVTPMVGVTALPTNTAVPQDTPTPIPTATASPTPTPTEAPATQAAPAQPTPVSTLAAPTLTPSVVTDVEGVLLNGVSMVYLPGGAFMMGSAATGPIHEVTLSPYYLDKYEVTNGQWAACVDAGACSPPASTRAYDGTPYYGVEAYDDYPVIFVNWYNADSFCHWRGVRLPTEAEWEMAARWDVNNAVGTLYPWGDAWDNTRLNYCSGGCPLVDSRDTSYDDGWAQAAPVGSFPTGVSPAGLLDMSGNVAEWVADRYSAAYYAESPSENPTGPESGTLRVVRGGSWGLSQPALLTATLRSSFTPSSQNGGIGFRCAVAASDVTQ